MGTIFALIFAAIIYFNPFAQAMVQDVNILGILMFVVAIFFIFFPGIVFAFSWTPLQRAEHNLTPRVLELFRSDNQVRWSNIWLKFFPLLTFLAAIDILYFETLNKTLATAIWIILFGISIDVLYHLNKRVFAFLNPFAVVSILMDQAIISVKKEEKSNLDYDIDALSEIAIMSIERSSISMSNHALNSLEKVMRAFLHSAKSLIHHERIELGQETTEPDPVSYTLFYFFQRMEMVKEIALDNRLEPIISNLITILGKITVYAAECDISLASYPVHYLGDFAQHAQQEGLQTVADKATLTLVQVAKLIIDEVDIKYLEIQDTYLGIIHYLDIIAKETFRQDKTTNLQILKKPFQDLKEIFKNEKFSSHQDATVINQKLDNVIEEFNALENVMKTMPPPLQKAEIGGASQDM